MAPSERDPLLPSAPRNNPPNIRTEVDGVESSLHSADSTQVDFPNEAGLGQATGPETLNFRLFLSLLLDSIPVILSYILQNSIQTTSVVIAGRLGPDELSVAAFSMMLAFKDDPTVPSVTPTGWCVALGGTTALDTLGSQAFTGGARPTDLSVHFQRCVLILWILLIPVGVLWSFSERILLALHQPPFLCRDVQRFLRLMVFGAPGYVGFESLKKYLQCQGIMGASTLVLAVVFPINIALNVYLIHNTPLGLLGSPVALSITYWLMFALLGLLTCLNPAHKRNATWGGFNMKIVLDPRSCYEFLKLALPGILMVGTEWAAFELVALASGLLGPVPLAAQSVIMTTDQILNTIPFGIGVAASTRVGNLIGSRSVLGAKYASHASAVLSVIVGFIVMGLMMAFKDVYGYLFSDDRDVVKLVSQVMPLVASFQVADGLAGSCGGVLRGQGRQHLGAFFNIVAYYVLALPIGATLAFHSRTHLGLQGLWIGQVVGLFIVGIGEYGVVWLGTDWDAEIQKGIERNREEAKRQALHDAMYE
ncbi:MOP flippase [Pluteus cervinus]|uniref:MOP flippase n=1 Tax=Pluteus cervinus TaxID=181527 RepID=A0ACD3AT07_9AGAR|nr:MOP flippase [Pluteus cervinus]